MWYIRYRNSVCRNVIEKNIKNSGWSAPGGNQTETNETFPIIHMKIRIRVFCLMIDTHYTMQMLIA